MHIKCPICKKNSAFEKNPWRPFCSERCKLIDLGKWATEEYRIPVQEMDSQKESEEGKEDIIPPPITKSPS